MNGLVLVLAGALLSACATAPGPEGASADPNDPYEHTNRAVFEFNQKVDRAVFLPTAKFYVTVVPEPARDGVHNFLQNLDAPVVFANDVLQGELKRAGQTVGRFGINSTIGIGGLLDVASKMGIPEHKEDFGQTLGVWGAHEGPYMMLPLLGPSNPRDSAGQIGDYLMDPLTWIKLREHFYWSAGRFTLNAIDLRSRNIDTLADIERTSVDYYASVRSLYHQMRENEIRNGAPDTQNLPNF